MKKKDMMNSMSKIIMSKADEEEIWKGIADNKSKSDKKHIDNKRIIKFVIASCLVILLITMTCNDTVRAAMAKLGTDFFTLLGNDNNYDMKNIGTCDLEEPLTMRENNISVTVNQCIFSNCEMLLDYSITADSAKKKIQDDKMNVSYEIYADEKNVSYEIFERGISGEGVDSNYYPNAQNTVEDENTVEIIQIQNGSDFLYEGKVLKLVIIVSEGEKNTKFSFEIYVNKLYQEKSMTFNEEIIDNCGNQITNIKVTNTFSKIVITGMGPLESPKQLNLLDASGKQMKFTSCGTGTIDYPFEYEFRRNSLDEEEKYTLQVYDKDGSLLKEIPISFSE